MAEEGGAKKVYKNKGIRKKNIIIRGLEVKSGKKSGGGENNG